VFAALGLIPAGSIAYHANSGKLFLILESTIAGFGMFTGYNSGKAADRVKAIEKINKERESRYLKDK
ncbi:hypothetical protein ACFL4T_12815, partial [candidate division KSB1 bacterium]